ncbi:MAG TPA: GTP-binding protein [Myxococcota bacterium]|nr:GTP-binding protein [Myxococcota bacterium]
MRPSPRRERIPVLVVSGFLGSGKTSLVRHLLDDAARRGIRAAVVSNELGELGVDAELLAGRPGDYVEIAGGCVCCKLSDELVATLAALRERANPDRILIETSGAALPYDTQLHLWRDPVRRFVEDDVAVVVVNAEQLAQGRDTGDTFAQQVSSADLLLLNQIDRVPAASLPALEEKLRAFEPEAPILRAAHGRIDPELLFPPDLEGLRALRRERGAAPSPHVHEDYVADIVELPADLDESTLLARLRALRAVRIKGFAQTRAGARLVQGVGTRIELRTPERPPPPELLGRVVAIRKNA